MSTEREQRVKGNVRVNCRCPSVGPRLAGSPSIQASPTGVLRTWPPVPIGGFLRPSLVTCPLALYPATSESEKASFNQLNRKTGHRIKFLTIDAETGEAAANHDIVKGYPLDKDTLERVEAFAAPEFKLATCDVGWRMSADGSGSRSIASPWRAHRTVQRNAKSSWV
jgi:Ku70/Ku80 beta-barrel domain